MTRPATVFLDRDGVIDPKPPPGQYVRNWREFTWLPGVPEAIRRLTDAGHRVIIVTNQQGIAKGAMSAEDVDDIHHHMREELRRSGTDLDGIYVCPHLEGTCDCRKPRTGLFRFAQRDMPDIDFSRSFVVGDSETDIQAGRAIGAATIRIAPEGTRTRADMTVPELPAAVDRILAWR